jgi:hypothetical protein
MGAMQFTIGSNAQFTLGQTFEISIGPPKIELHKAHSVKYDPVRILCVILGVLSEVFYHVYDLLKGSNNVSQYTNSTGDAQAAALASEESGDQKRAIFILSYQAVTDIMLVSIMLAEYLTDTVDWIGCDAAKAAYVVDHPLGLWKATPKLPVSLPFIGTFNLINEDWSGGGQIALGLAGVALVVLAEVTDIPHIGDSSSSQ